MNETKVYLFGIELKNISPLIVDPWTNKRTLKLLEAIRIIKEWTGRDIKSIDFEKDTQ